jgi:hypothetical protein
VHGVIADQYGHVRLGDECCALPSTEYRSQQARVPVRLEHRGPTVGQLKHLERDRDGRLIALCEVDCNLVAAVPMWFSPTVLHRNGRDLELLDLALTRAPASIALPSVHVRDGDLRELRSRHDVDERDAEMYERAWWSSRRDGALSVCVGSPHRQQRTAYATIRNSPPGVLVEHGAACPILSVS